MIARDLAGPLARDAALFPSVTVVGPRESGKSTLCRELFPDHVHLDLERPDVREEARQDPRGLIARASAGAVFDEVQHVPELLSWLQVAIDEDRRPGRFVLTGSNQHALSAAVAQSLAGRTSVLTLLPPDRVELGRFATAPAALSDALWTGSYPRIFDEGLPADRWLASYVATYVERDVRQLLNVADLVTFGAFLRVVASRTGQEVNLSTVGADAGVAQSTARAWLSVLESSFLVTRVPAWSRNVRKQIVKAPKLHVLDSGLAANLLGVRTPTELDRHPLRGALFESWVAAEVYKQRVHRGLVPRLFHWRESRGLEVDLVVDDGARLWLVESKSGQTLAGDWFRGLAAAAEASRVEHPHKEVVPVLVYGGEEELTRSGVRVVPWAEVGALAP
jgi:uncharacterized protein